MNSIILTQNSTPIIGQVASILGIIMEAIFNFIDFIGIPNIGLAIILFTVVVNLLMMPLTIKQQKFSKLSAKMNPEIQAINEKYKNRKDNDSQMAQSNEIQAVYAKYGVSATGSCAQLLIQMPILFALYQVIYNIPAYVGKVYSAFEVLAQKIISVDNAAFIQNSEVESIQNTVMMYGKALKDGVNVNGVIDVLNRLNTTDLAVVAEHYGLGELMLNGSYVLSNETATGLIDTYNNFFGLNMGNAPSHIISQAIATGSWMLIIGAVMIPLLSGVTQWINTKLMPTQQNSKKGQENPTENSMKMMNKIMPVMSVWFCFTLPCGLGLYWIAGSVIRSILQVVINKQMDKMDIDEIIKKNSVKSAKKMEKLKKQQEMMNQYASMNTKNIKTGNNANSNNTAKTKVATASSSESTTAKKTASSSTNSSAKPGSMMAKANMVKNYNEKNNNK